MSVPSKSGGTAYSPSRILRTSGSCRATSVLEMVYGGEQLELERMLRAAPARLLELETDTGDNLLMCARQGGHDYTMSSLLKFGLT